MVRRRHGDRRTGRQVQTYLPHAERDYVRFGTLSASSQPAVTQIGRHVAAMGQGVTISL
jgi:hypothetical protein